MWQITDLKVGPVFYPGDKTHQPLFRCLKAKNRRGHSRQAKQITSGCGGARLCSSFLSPFEPKTINV